MLSPVEQEKLLPTHPVSRTLQSRKEAHTAWENSCVHFSPQSGLEKLRKDEQNIEIIQGELQLEFIELLQVQTPPVPRWAYTAGGHPQTPGDRGNADEETGLPGEEDRTRTYDSQEEWHKKQAG